MLHLPDTAKPYYQTTEFTESTVPAALLQRHTTRAGVWARIFVTEGRLHYHVLDGADPARSVTPGQDAIVQPGVAHRLELDGAVRFRVEFLRDEAELPPLEEVLAPYAD